MSDDISDAMKETQEFFRDPMGWVKRYVKREIDEAVKNKTNHE